MRILGTIFYTLCTVLLIGVAGMFLVSLVPNLSARAGNVEIKIVKSGSMEPSIPVGALVLIKPGDAYGVGDVITFGKDTKTEIPTTHRIVSVDTGSGVPVYQTKGDANEESDPQTVLERDIIGRVLLNVPYAGYILDFARQPVGFALLIGLPAAIIILDELVTIMFEVRKMLRRRRPGVERLVSRKPQRTRPEETRTVMFRRSRVDDILIPIRVRIEPPPAAPRAGVSGGAVAGIVVLIMLVLAVAATKIGSTVSYFNNVEVSKDNELRAGTLDVTIEFNDSPEAFLALQVDEEEPSGNVTSITPLVFPGAGSFLPQYHLFIEKIEETDGLCDALLLSVQFEGEEAYQGALLGFPGTTTKQFGQWEFTMELPEHDASPEGARCTVDVVFSAWREDTHLFVDSGYTDEERVVMTMTKEGTPENSQKSFIQNLFFDDDEPFDETVEEEGTEETDVGDGNATPTETTTESTIPEEDEEQAEETAEPPPMLPNESTSEEEPAPVVLEETPPDIIEEEVLPIEDEGT
jgi:signal peptidase